MRAVDYLACGVESSNGNVYVYVYVYVRDPSRWILTLPVYLSMGVKSCVQSSPGVSDPIQSSPVQSNAQCVLGSPAVNPRLHVNVR
jgi:hypothetical protein